MLILNTREFQKLYQKTKNKSGQGAKATQPKTKPSDNSLLAKDGGPMGRSPVTEREKTIFRFSMNICPQPKERARVYLDNKLLVSAFKKANGDIRKFMALIKTQGMRAATPEKTRNFESAIRLAAGVAMKKQGLDMFRHPVSMDIVFSFSGDARFWPTSHRDGDLDNLEKSLKDALIGVVYADDRLVVEKRSIKVCGERDEIVATIAYA